MTVIVLSTMLTIHAFRALPLEKLVSVLSSSRSSRRRRSRWPRNASYPRSPSPLGRGRVVRVTALALVPVVPVWRRPVSTRTPRAPRAVAVIRGIRTIALALVRPVTDQLLFVIISARRGRSGTATPPAATACAAGTRSFVGCLGGVIRPLRSPPPAELIRALISSISRAVTLRIRTGTDGRARNRTRGQQRRGRPRCIRRRRTGSRLKCCSPGHPCW